MWFSHLDAPLSKLLMFRKYFSTCLVGIEYARFARICIFAILQIVVRLWIVVAGLCIAKYRYKNINSEYSIQSHSIFTLVFRSVFFRMRKIWKRRVISARIKLETFILDPYDVLNLQSKVCLTVAVFFNPLSWSHASPQLDTALHDGGCGWVCTICTMLGRPTSPQSTVFADYDSYVGTVVQILCHNLHTFSKET